MSMARDSVRTFIWQVAGLGLTVVSGAITSRVLGPSDRGLLALLFLYPTIFTTLGNPGLGVSLIHHIGRRELSLDRFVGASWFLAGLLGILGWIAFGVSLWLAPDLLYRGIPRPLLLVAMAVLPWSLGLAIASGLFQGVLAIDWYNVFQQVPKVISLAIVLGLLAVNRFGVAELVVAGTLVTVGLGSLAFWRMYRVAGSRPVMDLALARRLLRDGLKIHLGGIAMLVCSRANLLIVNYYLSATEVGYLYVAITLAELIWLISASGEIALYPRAAHKVDAEAVAQTTATCRQVLALSLMAGMILAAGAPLAVWAYGGPRFRPATPVLWVLIPGIVAFVISKVLSALWVRRGWFLLMSCVAAGTGVANLALNFLLIPRWGTVGAGIATSLAYGANVLVALLLYYQTVSHDLRPLVMPRLADWLWSRTQIMGGPSADSSGP